MDALADNPSGCTVLRTIEQAHSPISTASKAKRFKADAKALLDQIWTDELRDDYPQWAELLAKHDTSE